MRSKSSPIGDPVWGNKIEHGKRVEALTSLKHITEHFIALVFSQPQNRYLDGERVIVMGAMSAIADALMRVETIDKHSPLCEAFSGRLTVKDRERDALFAAKVFGTSAALFAKQISTTNVMLPELIVTTASCLSQTTAIETCPPVELRTGDGATRECRCSNRFDVLNCANSMVHFIDRR